MIKYRYERWKKARIKISRKLERFVLLHIPIINKIVIWFHTPWKWTDTFQRFYVERTLFFIRCEEEASLILSSFSEMPLLLPLSGFDRRTFDLNCASTLPFPSQPGKRSIFSRRDPPAEWTFTPPFVLPAAGHRHSGKNRGRSALPRFIHGLAPSISLFQRFIRGAPLKRFCR